VQITRQADYAIRTILYLSKLDPSSPVATRQIAKEQSIPPSFLAKIVSQLSLVGLLHTSRGATGGVLLSRNPVDITLLEVIEAIDGPITVNECAGDRGTCSMCQTCAMHPIFCEIRAELVSKLKSYTFDKIVKESEPVFEIPSDGQEIIALTQL
jgi:Rrf2 family protein